MKHQTSPKSPRSQTSIGLSIRCHALLTALAKHEKRKLSQQVELITEAECNRLGIKLPTETPEA